MLRNLLKASVSGLVVNEAPATLNLAVASEALYLPKNVMKALDLWPFELVHLSNSNNGARLQLALGLASEDQFEGQALVLVSGPAAFLVQPHHHITLQSYGWFAANDLAGYQPKFFKMNQRKVLESVY